MTHFIESLRLQIEAITRIQSREFIDTKETKISMPIDTAGQSPADCERLTLSNWDHILLVAFGDAIHFFESRNPLHCLLNAVDVKRSHAIFYRLFANVLSGRC